MEDCKKVGKFLKNITEIERVYLHHVLNLTDQMKSLMSENQLTKEQFCQFFEINESAFEDYISGNYNYTLMDAAKLNAAWKTLTLANMKEPVTVS